MFLLTFVIAPIVGLISQFGLGIEPWPVGVVVFGLGIGGLLRIAYALMFESRSTTPSPRLSMKSDHGFENTDLFSPPAKGEIAGAAAQEARINIRRASQWLETNDLQPQSVTDSTTKLLEQDIDEEG